MNDPELERVMNELIEKINDSVNLLLKREQYELCIKILKKCEIITQPYYYGIFPSLRALIYNNFGCYYKRITHYK
jgi:hypothetical protein